MNPPPKIARRVAIIGAGVVSPLGFGLGETLQSLRNGTDCVTPVTAFSVDKTRCKTAGQISDSRLLQGIRRSRRDRRLHRASHMVIAALDELWSQTDGFGPEVVMAGTTSGGMTFGERFYRTLGNGGCSASLIANYPPQKQIVDALEKFGIDAPAQGLTWQRIAIPVQLVFAVVIAAYWLVMSIIGGAVLARYLLPAIPLVIILCVSTLRRRVRGWPVIIALVAAAFVLGLLVNPPYVFAPEDNLAYRDFVQLHQQAADFLQTRHPNARVLTAWPASDELSRPWLGYVRSPFKVLQLESFTREELQAAMQNQSFDFALVFSTKYQPSRPLWTPQFWKRAQTRFFGSHSDAQPFEAAQVLGGRVIYEQRRTGEWIAVIEMPEVRLAAGY